MDSPGETHANWQCARAERGDKRERRCLRMTIYDLWRRTHAQISLSLSMSGNPGKLWANTTLNLLACPDIRRRSDRAAASCRQRQRRETWLAGGVYNVAAARAQSGSSYVAAILLRAHRRQHRSILFNRVRTCLSSFTVCFFDVITPRTLFTTHCVLSPDYLESSLLR